MNAPDAPSAVLPTFEEELAADQRRTLRVGAFLASGLIVCFAGLDAWLARPHWLLLLAVRVAATCVLLAVGALAGRPGARPLLTAAIILAAVCVPIEAGVFVTGGAHSAYLYSMLLPMAAVSILVPFATLDTVALHAEVLAIALVPLAVGAEPAEARAVVVPGSFMLTMAVIGFIGARLQQDLRQREYRARAEAARQLQLAHLGQLAGGLAHELSNPLAAMSLELELADRRRTNTSPGMPNLERLKHGVERMREILTAMRQGARVADGQLREVDLVKQVELSLTLLAPQLREVKLSSELQPVPPVSAQPTLLGQVLVNLLINAMHAVRDQPERQVAVRTLFEGGAAVIEVEDNGPGVPAELRERIFEPMFSTKGEEGNGLGLWISAEIARFHRGNLSVTEGNKLGGALFRLLLPVEGASQRADA